MIRNRYFAYVAALILLASLAFGGVALARGGFGGGGHSSFGGGHSSFGGGGSHSFGGGSSSFGGGSRSSGGGFSPFSGGRSSGWGSSRRSTPSGSPVLGGGGGSSPAPQISAADRALYSKAKTQGTVYSNRSSAEDAFRAKYGSSDRYRTQFNSQPSQRPDYVPQSTTVGGQSVPVQYDPSHRGYGYYQDGRWHVYDVLRDAVMLHLLMRRDHYYYGPAPYATGYPGGGYGGGYSSGPHFPWGWLIFAIIVWLIIRSLARRARGNASRTDDTVPRTEVRDQGTSMELSDPRFWTQVGPGSIITLKDEQALEDSQRKGRGLSPMDYQVKEARTIDVSNGLGALRMFHLDDTEQSIWFVAKIVDQDIDLRVYFEPPESEFAPGNRRDMLDRGDLWLFQEPANPNNYRPKDLRFTLEIVQSVQQDGGTKQVTYEAKGDELYGEMTVEPKQSGMSDQVMVTVVEYRATEPTENPEALIIETGGENTDDGGLISLMLGSPIRFSEVDVLPKRQ